MKKQRKNITKILEEFGWANYDVGTVRINGKNHTAYAIEENPWNFQRIKPAKYKELVEGIKANFKHVWEDKTYCEYAPEIRHNWVAAW